MVSPLRISSEAPEAVQDDQSPYRNSRDKIFVRSYSRANSSRATQPLVGHASKSVNDIPSQNNPRLREHALQSTYSPQTKSKRNIGLIPLCLVAVTAFLVGGAIGGGIGSWAGKHAGASSTSNSKSTSTSPCNPSTTTMVVDFASYCPSINNHTYITPAPAVQFLIACYTDITPSPGEDIELTNVTTRSLDECMNACATYNDGQCQAATWIQSSPTRPLMNSKCFLKANKGVSVGLNSTETVATSAYRLPS